MAIIDGDFIHHEGHGIVPLFAGCDCIECKQTKKKRMANAKELNAGDIYEARWEGNYYTLIKEDDDFSCEYGGSQRSYLPNDAVEVVKVIARSKKVDGRIITEIPNEW